MTVLLTRPQGRNQALATQLRAQGRAVVETPLLQLAPLPNTLTAATVQSADLLIFVSANAVDFAAQLRQAQQLSWPTQALYFGVGSATCARLSALGLTPLQPATDNQQSEGLLELPELQAVAGKRVLIVRGLGGRELLADTLRARGAQVDYWEVYQRVCPNYDGYALVAQWQHAGVTTITVTSPVMLDYLIQLIPKELFSWLQTCHIIVPSHRAEAQAIQLGFKQVTNARGASASAMLTALK